MNNEKEEQIFKVVCEDCGIELKHFEECPTCHSTAYHLTKVIKEVK